MCVNQISQETRNRKGLFKADEVEELRDLINEFAESQGITVEEACELAIFRLSEHYEEYKRRYLNG
ncbi:MAG: hypothetical protein IJV29_06410 [Butyrivibrio sp.]|nr:hypothetical protein [Butyrivibrio sp.]